MMVGPAAGGGGGGFYRTLTIDHTLVGSSDSSNFPVLVSGTYTYLKTVANGGKVQNTSGFDVGFFSDSALTTRLKHETERYVASTGEVIYWVKVPAVSHTSDTVIYMNYGNASITTDQSDHVNVWDSNYYAVYHLGDGSSVSVNDSTANAVTGTNTSATATTGQIGGGIALSGSAYIQTPNIDTGGVTACTVSCWVKPSAHPAFGGIVFSRDGSHDPTGLMFNQTGDGRLGYIWNHNDSNTYSWDSGAGTIIPNGSWSYCVLRITSTAGTVTANGTTGTNAIPHVSDSLGAYGIGGDINTPRLLTGSLDEVRFSKIARSLDWCTAEYNNQLTPSTFYSVGAETPA